MSGLGKVLLIVVLAASASAAEQAAALKQFLVEQVKGGAKPVLPVKTGPGKATPTTVLAADETGLKVNAQGAELNLTWKMIGEDGLYELVAPLMPDAPAATHAVYLEWGITLGRAKDAGFQKLLEKLYEKDNAAARRIESALKAPAAGPAPADAAAGQTASGNGKTPPADDLARLLGSVVGRDGKVDRGAYLREALGGDLQAINRMCGPDYEYFHKGAKPEEFPTLPAATDQSTGKIGRNGKGFTYQFGTPVADPGGYWSTEGQLLYVPDKPNDPGVDRVDVASYGHHCLQLKPEHAWWGGAHPEPGVKQKAWLEAAGGSLGQPFEIERAYWSFSENGFMLFKSGLMAAGAVCNIYTYPFFMFPRHKVPMAVALTHKNEFALVAVWDTQELKGQLAVFALGAVENHEKPKTAWALPGWGVIGKVKLLGYVDLPGLAAPSAVSVTVNNTAVLSPVSFNEHNLDDAAVREKHYKGSDREQIASAGCAVLISRSENKMAVVDLRPLFGYFREMCFTTAENAAKVKDSGPDPKQWPYTFEVEPRAKPQVAAVVDVPQPVSLRTSPFGHNGHPALAVVGSLDGRLFAYDISAFTKDSPAGAQDVKPFAMGKVGRNPCCIAVPRYADPFRRATQGSDVGGWFSMSFTFLVCCRGDREIDWVEITKGGVEVYRRLRDSRIVDPVHCQQTRINSPDGAYLVTIADFKGRKLLNYRVGDAQIDGKKFPIPDGKSEVEFTGAMEFPGHPFRICSDNVP